MPHKPRPPFAHHLPFGLLLPKKYKPTVTFCICLTLPSATHTLQSRKTLRDGCFHLCHGADAIRRDISRAAVHAMHDESALVHTCFRSLDEVEVVRTAGPGGVDVG